MTMLGCIPDRFNLFKMLTGEQDSKPQTSLLSRKKITPLKKK